MLFLPLSIAATGFEKRSSSYSNHKKWRPPSVESIGVSKESELIVFKQALLQFCQTRHLRLDNKMIFPTMLLNTQCNEKWQRYGCLKELARSAALHSNDHDSTNSTSDEKRRSLVGSTCTSQSGWSCTKLHGASSCRGEQASKSCHDDRQNKGEPSTEARRLVPETPDHPPRYRYRLLVSLLNNRLLRF